jgi:hypothetical protein
VRASAEPGTASAVTASTATEAKIVAAFFIVDPSKKRHRARPTLHQRNRFDPW